MADLIKTPFKLISPYAKLPGGGTPPAPPVNVVVNGEFTTWTLPFVPDGWELRGSAFVQQNPPGNASITDGGGADGFLRQTVLEIGATYSYEFKLTAGGSGFVGHPSSIIASCPSPGIYTGTKVASDTRFEIGCLFASGVTVWDYIRFYKIS